MNETIELPASCRLDITLFTDPLALAGAEMTQNSTKMIATIPSSFLMFTAPPVHQDDAPSPARRHISHIFTKLRSVIACERFRTPLPR